MPVFADLVRVTTTTTGTGPLDLGPAVSGFRSFGTALTEGDLTDGCTVAYSIHDKTADERETGIGVYTDGAPDTLTRVLRTSTTGALLDLSGDAEVFITPAAVDFPASFVSVDVSSLPLVNTINVNGGTVRELKPDLSAGSRFIINYDDDCALWLKTPDDLGSYVGVQFELLFRPTATAVYSGVILVADLEYQMDTNAFQYGLGGRYPGGPPYTMNNAIFTVLDANTIALATGFGGGTPPLPNVQYHALLVQADSGISTDLFRQITYYDSVGNPYPAAMTANTDGGVSVYSLTRSSGTWASNQTGDVFKAFDGDAGTAYSEDGDGDSPGTVASIGIDLGSAIEMAEVRVTFGASVSGIYQAPLASETDVTTAAQENEDGSPSTELNGFYQGDVAAGDTVIIPLRLVAG